MPSLLAYIFAAVVAWCLFSPHGFFWLVPSLLLVAAAYLTREARVASWMVAGFAGLLAYWSVWAFRRAQEPGGIGIILLGMTPLMQLFAIIVVLLPLLLSQRIHRRPPGLTTRRSEYPSRDNR